MKHYSFLFILFAATSCSCFSQANTPKVIKSYSIPSDGGWDYIAVNNHKIYVSHGTQVNILDENSGDSIGVIPGTTGVHGIAFDNSLNRGYTSNGRLNNVFVFDLATNKILNQISTGENPDAISYEPFTKTIITCNGRGKSLSVIDPTKAAVIATIQLDAKPEEAVSNGKGKLYVNLEDKNEIAEIDMKAIQVLNRWSIAPGESATGLVLDTKTNRLFAGCNNKMLAVVDASNGKVITTVPIGDGCDGVVFDEQEKMVYASCGEGIITAIKEISENKFEVAATIPTKRSARTITIDQRNHTLFLPAADIAPAEPGTDEHARRKMVPGSFQVLVVK
jgi:DNA-binding beta-propeller fold protein YncE